MSNLTTYPLTDAFSTLAAQAWDGNIGRVYLNAVPDFTFPSGVVTYIGVDMKNSLRQVAVINQIDPVLKRVYVSSISVNKGAGVAYTAQQHKVNAKVIISDNYQFRKDIDTAIRSKVNTNDEVMFQGYYATLVARDAAIPSPVSGKYSAFTLEEGIWRDYDSSGRSARQGGTTVNATDVLAGKAQAATQAKTEQLSDTGSSGALNFILPSRINPSNITAGSPALLDKASSSDVSDSNYLKSATRQTILNLLNTGRYGDGSDGDVTISGTVTLTRDMYYNNLSIPVGQILDPAGFRIFVRGTISGTGTIQRPGNNGGNATTSTGGVAATTLGQGSLNAEVAAGAGPNGVGASSNGTAAAGTASNPSLANANGAAGGAGGSGASGFTGGSSTGGVSTRGALYNKAFFPMLVHMATAQTTFGGLNYKGIGSSAGGGSGCNGAGTSGSSGGGGGGGGNGGLIWIAAYNRNFTGTVSAPGGTGGNGGASATTGGAGAGGGGGGGGGNGGILLRIYSIFTAEATITLTGGAGGSAGASNGGSAPTASSAGTTGQTISIII